jgi:hypothetical protein
MEENKAMKKTYIVLAFALAAVLSACVGDLDRLPLAKSDFTSEVAYDSPESYAQGLAKIYAGFALTGQNGVGETEISVADAGASELIREWWSLQELSTDAAKVAWVNDLWTYEVNTNTWTTFKNDALAAIYERTILITSLVNEYFRQTADDRLSARGVDAALKATIQRYRAEARFIRAYCYWMMMDAFGNPPFVTENSPLRDFPPQISRTDLFKWIEAELVALTQSGDMPAIGAATYPQVDKGAVWGLLARIYLNAGVYTGTPRWADAKTAASNVIAGPYGLASEYAHLFMADNGQNPDTKKEMIFVADYDSEKTRSYGGTNFLINASMASGDEGRSLINGSGDGWGGIRTTYEYAQKYFEVSNPDYGNGTFTCPDKRALFYIKGRTQRMSDIGQFTEGWSVVKYNGFPHDVDLNNPPATALFYSTDFPMMRLAEMYLIYAEATLRAGAIDDTAVGYINDLRARAGMGRDRTTANVTLTFIIEERARELMWEAHRRTDLIRFDLYTGAGYLWPWKGGVENGRSIAAHYNLCPLLQDDVKLNYNLTQNPGYVE